MSEMLTFLMGTSLENTSKCLLDFERNPNKVTLASVKVFLNWFGAIENLNIKKGYAKNIFIYRYWS